jgi:hypothetical protein
MDSVSLDLYAAANTYPAEGATLARLTQEAAVRHALGHATTAELCTLLSFAHALSYLDDILYDALRTALTGGDAHEGDTL